MLLFHFLRHWSIKLIKKQIARLTLVTNKNHTPLDEYLRFIEDSAHAGIDSVQLREKKLDQPQIYQMAQSVMTPEIQTS